MIDAATDAEDAIPLPGADLADGSERDQREREAEGFLHIVQRRWTVAIIGLFVLAVFYTMYFAAPVLIPVTLAVLLNLLLSPAVDLLERIYVPRPIASLLVVVAMLGSTFTLAYVISGPAQSWLERVPATYYRVEQKLWSLKQPLEQIRQATEKLEQAASGSSGDPASDVQKVVLERPGISGLAIGEAYQFAATVGIVVILLLFLLSSGDTFLRKLIAVIPTLADKKRAVEIVRSMEADISFYLLTVTAINVCVGAMLALVAAWLGLPNPLLWGALAGIVSFAPYAGPTAMLIILSMVGMMHFSTMQDALMLPAAYLAIVIAANQFLLPIVIGRRLLLSPVAIFLAMILWGWMWGVVGALLAVPLLASFKIVCERIKSLRPIAEFLTP
ncbi:MAG: AI-2E family transporter [Hyphomicrobiaceae bacterium]|nr:AI-2E family transporter [Hyphomicrobiaceae bacterium]